MTQKDKQDLEKFLQSIALIANDALNNIASLDQVYDAIDYITGDLKRVTEIANKIAMENDK